MNDPKKETFQSVSKRFLGIMYVLITNYFNYDSRFWLRVIRTLSVRKRAVFQHKYLPLENWKTRLQLSNKWNHKNGSYRNNYHESTKFFHSSTFVTCLVHGMFCMFKVFITTQNKDLSSFSGIKLHLNVQR